MRAQGMLTLTKVTVISNRLRRDQDGAYGCGWWTVHAGSLVQGNSHQTGRRYQSSTVSSPLQTLFQCSRPRRGIFQTSTSGGLIISNTTFDMNKALTLTAAASTRVGRLLARYSISKTIVANSTA